jgi:hypothetical protein
VINFWAFSQELQIFLYSCDYLSNLSLERNVAETMLKLDHIVIAAESLSQGVDYIQNLLGVSMTTGGKHAAFGTHNALLSLGDAYLEVIAIDPDAPKPTHARWFGLDTFSGSPRLSNWVLQTDKPRRVIGKTLIGTGDMMTVSRDDLTWQITVPKSGHLPLDNCAPAVIDWMGADHPVTRLPDVGCRLTNLQIEHPHAISLKSFLTDTFSDPRVVVRGRECGGMSATIESPNGVVTLT